MKKEKIKAALLATALALTFTGCSLTPQEKFDRTARRMVTRHLQELTDSRKIHVQDIILTDTCWTMETIYDNSELSELQSKVDSISKWHPDISDREFFSDVEEIRRLNARMKEISTEKKTQWGYRALVYYRKGIKKDTVNCEISLDGYRIRAIKQGTEPFLGNDTETKMKQFIELCENL